MRFVWWALPVKSDGGGDRTAPPTFEVSSSRSKYSKELGQFLDAVNKAKKTKEKTPDDSMSRPEFQNKLQEWDDKNSVKEMRTGGVLDAAEDENSPLRRHVRLATEFLEAENDPDVFKVSFHNNNTAEWKVGFADMVPANVLKIQVKLPNETWDKAKEATRSLDFGTHKRIGFYYADGTYAKVFSGYEVKITEVKDPQSAEMQDRWKKEHDQIYKFGAMEENEPEEWNPGERLLKRKSVELGTRAEEAKMRRQLLGQQLGFAPPGGVDVAAQPAGAGSAPGGRRLETLHRDTVFEKIRAIPKGFKMMQDPVPQEIEDIAMNIKNNPNYKMGDKIKFELGEGKEYVAEVAWHPPRGKMKEWHRGAHVYEKVDSTRSTIRSRQNGNLLGVAAQQSSPRGFSGQETSEAGRDVPKKRGAFSERMRQYDPYIEEAIREAEQKYGVQIPVEMIHELIRQESGGIADIASPVGAGGIMQMMPETALGWGFRRDEIYKEVVKVGGRYKLHPNDARRDVRRAIRAGVLYFANDLKYFHGDFSLALAAYNAGRGAVNKYHGVPPYKETRGYVSNIMRKYNALPKHNQDAPPEGDTRSL